MDEANISGAAHGVLDDTVGHVKDAASAAVDTAKQGATTLVGSAKDKVSDTFEQSRQTVSHTLTDFAGAIRKAGDELAERDQSMAGRLVKQAADGLESLSQAAANKRPEELLDAARDFGRSNPVAFIAGSVLLGLALGRFAKSSASHTSAGSIGRLSAPTPAPAPVSSVGSSLPSTAAVWTGETDPVEYDVFSGEVPGRGYGLIGGAGGTGV